MMLNISVGEAVDKYTILEIKSERIKDELKLMNINKERLFIEDELCANDYFLKFHNEINELKQINEQLWDIEDQIRIKEFKKEFDQEFITLARSVYITNDKRFEVKNKINELSNSSFKEEKSYEKYN